MYPTLFQIGSFRIDTYSVMWFIALALAIVWAIHRLALYDLDEDESRRVMAVSFFFMLLGARMPEYVRHFSDYAANPSLLLDLNRGGMEEYGAILGAFISAMIMCAFSRKVSFLKLCEVAAIPAMLAITIGRWGCFLNGCCVGLPTDFFLHVHFPRDAEGLFRHPVQIYYSVIAGCIVLFLMWVERKVLPKQKKHFQPVIAPLALILYSLMRLAIIPVREGFSLNEIFTSYWGYMAILASIPLECLWLAYGLRKLKAQN